MKSTTNTSSPVPTVAELVENLFQTHRHETGREFTLLDVSIATEGRLKPTHLHALRTGKIKNPTRDKILALCQFFHVPCGYFFPELRDE